MAVDFEAKARARAGAGWALRNAKLRLSRKVLFAAGLLPVLECHRLRAEDMESHLLTRLSQPPLDRLADAFVQHDLADPGVRAVAAYDEFLAILDDTPRRDELEALAPEGAEGSELFACVRELGYRLQDALVTLLFDVPELERWVREYLVF